MAKSPAATSRPPCQLYLITPPSIDDLPEFSKTLEAALAAGEVAALQIRLKSATSDQIRTAVAGLAPVARRHGVVVILNDDPDLAKATGRDGVHVGQGDMDLAQARRIMGPDAMIGVTCHDSRHLAMEASEGGADYVAFGAFFPTATKTVEHRPDFDVLSIWQETMEIPCVAIGGATVETARALADAGADFIAVSAGVWAHPDGPAEAVKAFNGALAGAV